MKFYKRRILKKMKVFILIFLLIPFGMQLTACSEENITAREEEVPEKGQLVTSTRVATIPANTLKSLGSNMLNGALKDEIKYDIGVYKITYLTTYQGKEIKASGVVALPLNRPTPAPVISVQHGTIFKHDEAPTSAAGFTGFEVFAAGGYVTLVPDYLGFGASKQILHPYYNQKYSGLAVVDMIKAAKSLYKKEKIAVNDQLFLAGYSEGGYVTLAAQKEIETNQEHGLQVTASAAGAGGFDMTGMLANVVSGEPYPYPAYLAYVLMSMNNTYGWNRPLTDFYREPYATRLKTLFNGQHSGGSINSQLTTDPGALFSDAFMRELRGNGEQALKKALQENSFNDWVPQSPTRLYQGTADEIIPFANSDKVYKQMKEAGAPSISFMPINGGTHGSSFMPMLSDLVLWVKSFETK